MPDWRIRERDAAEQARIALAASERARGWFAVRIVLGCFAGMFIGAAPMAWALHTTDEPAGRVAWAIGQVLGPALVVVVLLYGWVRWNREEW